MALRPFEWIAVLYFASLIATAALLRVPKKIQRGVASAATTLIALVLVLASLQGAMASAVRDWIPVMYLLAGYWLPARLVTGSPHRLERMLAAFDRRCFGADGLAHFSRQAPRPLLGVLELSYLCCYPMVPLGFACLLLVGCAGETDRFWTAVLIAAFSCYGLLPWLPTRPPRAIELSAPATSTIREWNLRVLGGASHQLNTFPSGHAAASVAVALSVGVCSPAGGAAFAVLAAGIMAGSVVGRYHYAADAMAGAAVALIAFGLSTLVHAG